MADITGIYEGMLEAANEWRRLLEQVESEDLTEDQKKDLVKEYFRDCQEASE